VSDTPRTDAAAIRCACSTYVVPSEFARELERENAALRKERDSYRYRSEQIWGLRKEIQAALEVPSDCEGEEALKQGLAAIKTLRADKERLDWLEQSHKLWEGKDWLMGPEFISRAAIDAARKEAQP